MTNDHLAHEYFGWLVHQVGNGKGYYHLLGLMHEKEFVWFVPNDANRLQDGADLRLDFSEGRDLVRLPCVSTLEVLIGIARRLEFQTSTDASKWAMNLLENLELTAYRGRLATRQVEEVDEILENLIWRRYQADGTGGFFPLAWPEEDQRQVEIWYQMAAYLNEQPEW